MRLKNYSFFLAASAMTMVSLTSFAQLKYNQSDLDKFNKTNVCEKCDLSNLNSLDVQGYNHSGADLQGSDLSDSTLQLNIAHSNFKNCIFSNANLIQGVNASFSDFTGVDFTDASLSSNNFSHAIFTSVIMTNADLSRSNFNGTIGFTKEVYSKAADCQNMIMPDGSVHQSSDCSQ